MSITTIQNSVCEFFNLKPSDLHTDSRKRTYCFPRQIIMFLSIKHLKYTLERAGSIYNRDHATALNAKKRVLGFIETNIEVREQLKQIEALIYDKQIKSSIEVTHVDLLQLSINYTNSMIRLE